MSSVEIFILVIMILENIHKLHKHFNIFDILRFCYLWDH